MAGYKVRHLSEPEHQNDAVGKNHADENFLKRDGSRWTREHLHSIDFRITSPGNTRDGKIQSTKEHLTNRL